MKRSLRNAATSAAAAGKNGFTNNLTLSLRRFDQFAKDGVDSLTGSSNVKSIGSRPAPVAGVVDTTNNKEAIETNTDPSAMMTRVKPSSSTNTLSLKNLLNEWKQTYLSSLNHSSRGSTNNNIQDGHHSQIGATTTSINIISPYQMVQKLDGWKKNSPYVHPDGRSYALVLETAAEAATAAATSTSSSSETTTRRNLDVADDLLERLLRESEVDYTFLPTSSTFITVMNAFAQHSHHDERDRHLQHGRRQRQQRRPRHQDHSNLQSHKMMTEEGGDDDDDHHLIDQRPNRRVAGIDDPPASWMMIERWIDRMHQLHNDGWPDVEPTIVVYNVLLHSLAKSGEVGRMENLIHRMIQGEIPGISPDTVSFTTLLKAYSNSNNRGKGTNGNVNGTINDVHDNDENAAYKAESLLLQMEELYDNGIQSVRPNTISYTTVIECHAKSGAENAGEKAEAVLRRLEARWLSKTNDVDNNNGGLSGEVDVNMQPDVQSYNTVLSAYANMDKAERAEEILMSMLSNGIVEPNRVSFNTVMTAYGRRGDSKKAEAMLLQMHELSAELGLDTKPDVISYNIVLDSLAKAGNGRSKDEWQELAKRGRDILAHMERLYEHSDDDRVRPNSRTWNTCINIYAKAGMIDDANALLQEFAEAAAKTGDSRLVDGSPTVRTHNTLLSACMVRGQVALAMSFWHRMKNDGIQSDIVTYNTLLKCHIRALRRPKPVNKKKTIKSARNIMSQMERDHGVQPNHITYAAFVDVLIENDELEAAQKYLFDLVKDNSTNASATAPVPGRNTFHRVLAAWSQRKKPRKGEELIHRMSDASVRYNVDLQPSVETYNLLLQCWAESGSDSAGERAESILHFMQDSVKDVTPDIDSFLYTLESWRKSGDLTSLSRIDSLILEMTLKGDPSMLPNDSCYNVLLDAISESKISMTDKQQKAQDTMKSMKIHNFVPTGELKKKLDLLLSVKT